MNNMNITTSMHPWLAQDMANSTLVAQFPQIQYSAAAGIVFISLIGMLGAGLVILVASMKHSYNAGSNNHLFLISLCSMDFVLCAFSFVFSLQNITAGGKWAISPAECIAMGMVVTATVFNSLMSCGLVALDRYLLVVFRVSIPTHIARALVAVTWIVNLIIQIVPLFNTVDMTLFGTGDAMLICTPLYMNHTMANWSLAGLVAMAIAVIGIAYAYLHIIWVVIQVRLNVSGIKANSSTSSRAFSSNNSGTNNSNNNNKKSSSIKFSAKESFENPPSIISAGETSETGGSAANQSRGSTFKRHHSTVDTYERSLVIQSIGVVALCLLCHVGPHAVKLIYGILMVSDPGLTTDMATSVLIVLNAALNGWAVFAMNNRLREKALSLLKSSRKF